MKASLGRYLVDGGRIRHERFVNSQASDRIGNLVGGRGAAVLNQLDADSCHRYEGFGDYRGHTRMAKRQRKSSGRMASKGFPNPIDVHVGARIRLRRTLLGISQTALAEMIGLTFQQVQKYEKGNNRVSSSRLVDVANALDVSLSYFFEEMSAGVKAQSPAELVKTNKRPEFDEKNDPPMARRETLELVRAYYKIQDPAVRKRLRELVGAVSRG